AASLLASVAASQSLPQPAIAQPAPMGQPSLAPPALPSVPAVQPIPAAGWTAERIRQSFDQADSNSDDQLTRAEALRLTILPHSFEEMDENKDGVVSRAEYERAFSR
ncbi:MAG TPA: EF-hand domain-containing protein, partial [Ramlibacter sp.]|nr:EF-hand domain-containing protein [Ramlibacter sp.]